MCVMDCLVFTGSGTFHTTRSHTSHLPVTPRDTMMCAGMFHLACGYMALGLGASDIDMGSMAGFTIPRV